MDLLPTFISAVISLTKEIFGLIGSVAWPAVVLAGVLLFRRQLAEIIPDVEEVAGPGGLKAKRYARRTKDTLGAVNEPREEDDAADPSSNEPPAPVSLNVPTPAEERLMLQGRAEAESFVRGQAPQSTRKLANLVGFNLFSRGRKIPEGVDDALGNSRASVLTRALMLNLHQEATTATQMAVAAIGSLVGNDMVPGPRMGLMLRHLDAPIDIVGDASAIDSVYRELREEGPRVEPDTVREYALAVSRYVERLARWVRDVVRLDSSNSEK